MPLDLGRTPDALAVRLTRGAVFAVALAAQDPDGLPADWPAGTTLRLELVNAAAGGNTDAVSWPWTITGPTAALTVPAGDVDALPGYPLRSRLWLNIGSGEFLWASGKVTWRA